MKITLAALFLLIVQTIAVADGWGPPPPPVNCYPTLGGIVCR